MSIFYKVPQKIFFKTKREIFAKYGLPALQKNGFVKLPYSGARFGEVDSGICTYDLCRLNKHGHFEMITTYITPRDKWIKVFLNIFELRPTLTSVDQLLGSELMQFFLPPNSITQMQLRLDDFKGMPLFRTVEHRIKSYYSERGFQKRVKELATLIEKDLTNIDSFVQRWYEMHRPIVTDWKGKEIG